MRDGSRHPGRGHSDGIATTLGAASHIGKHRVSNQDAFCALVGSHAPGELGACVAVADGMGGHRAGEVASALAIQKLTRRLGRRRAGSATSSDEVAALEADIAFVNEEIHRAGMEPEFQGMGTTLTAGLLVGTRFFLGHVGDSRAYLLRDGQLGRLTRDHNWFEEQLAAGLISPQEAATHPHRNMLTRALGIAQSVEVDTAAVDVRPGDTLLLCSDGLHGLVDDKEIARILRDKEPQRACDALVERANTRGGNDNITVVVLRIDRVPALGARDGGQEPAASASASESRKVDVPKGPLGNAWKKLKDVVNRPRGT